MDAVGPILSGAAALGLYALAIALLAWGSLHAMLAVHEAGHAIAARLMGLHVRLIEIGSGYELARLPFGLTQIRWRLWPTGGLTMLHRPFVLKRSARIPYVFGGCGANLVAALALFAAMEGRSEQVRLYLLVLVVGQLIGLFEIVTFRRPQRTGLTPDGGALFAAVRDRPVHDRAWMRAYLTGIRHDYRGPARERATQLSPVVLHAVHVGGADRSPYADSPREDWEPDEARRLRMALLDRTGLTVSERAALLDALITDDLLTVDLDRLPALDHWSGALVALLPEDPNANASRGAVLSLMGRQDARKHLEMDLGPDAGRYALALQSAFLSRAFLNEGDVEAARRHVAAARKCWNVSDDTPDLPIILLMEDVLSRARP